MGGFWFGAEREGGGSREARLLDVAEVAAVLNVSKSKVYKMVEAGEIVAVRIGRTVRVRQEGLERAINDMAR